VIETHNWRLLVGTMNPSSVSDLTFGANQILVFDLVERDGYLVIELGQRYRTTGAVLTDCASDESTILAALRQNLAGALIIQELPSGVR
jgi:hypothetical protein